MTSLRRPPRSKMNREELDHFAPFLGLLAIADNLLPSLVRPGEAVDFSRMERSAIVLAPGYHPVITANKKGAILSFMPGASVGRLKITKDCTVIGLDAHRDSVAEGASAVVTVVGSNVIFRGGSIVAPGSADCLAIDATSSVVVDGVSFHKASGDNLVSIEALGKAIFVGCIFGPATSTATATVNNAGVAAAVDITGCVKQSPGAHVAVTIVSEV